MRTTHPLFFQTGMLFDWLYPAHFPTILSCLSAWADTPAVTTPLLKFMSEFVHNRTQRLTFDSSSPNGILLFREVSKVLVTYGTMAAGSWHVRSAPSSTLARLGCVSVHLVAAQLLLESVTCSLSFSPWLP